MIAKEKRFHSHFLRCNRLRNQMDDE